MITLDIRRLPYISGSPSQRWCTVFYLVHGDYPTLSKNCSLGSVYNICISIPLVGSYFTGCNTLSVSGRPRYWNINMVGVYKKTDRILYGRSVYEQKASRKPTYQIYYEDHMEQGNWKIIKNPRKEVTLAFAEDSSMEPQYIKGSWKIRKYKYNLEIYEERELLIECKGMFLNLTLCEPQ